MTSGSQDKPSTSASTERIVQLLAHYERHKCERTRRELAEGLVNAAKVAVLKDMDDAAQKTKRKSEGGG